MELTDTFQQIPSDLLLRNSAAQAVETLPQAGQTTDPEKLQEVAKKFEGLFLNEILKQMKEASAPLEDESEDCSAEHIKGMYWTFLADAVSERGGFGFWKQIHKQLSELTAPSAKPPVLNEAM